MELDEIKEIKLKDLKYEFERYAENPIVETYLSSSNEKILVDGSQKDKINFENGQYLGLEYIKSADNKTYKVEKYDYDRIIYDILKNGLNTYQKKWEYENIINNAEDVEDLNNLYFEF